MRIFQFALTFFRTNRQKKRKIDKKKDKKRAKIVAVSVSQNIPKIFFL